MRVTRKLTLALIAGIVVVHAAAAVVRVAREVDLFNKDIARNSRVLGRALANAVERAWRSEGENAAMGFLDHATHRDDHVRIRWVWLDGSDDPLSLPGVESAQLVPLTHNRIVVLRLESAVYTFVPVTAPDGRIGAVEVMDPLADEEEYMRGSVVAATIGAGILVALCAALAWVLGLVLVGRPVQSLVAQARRVAQGDLTQRLSPHSDDELGELAEEMNQMVEGLQAAWERTEAESRARIDVIEQLRHVDRLRTVGTLASGVAHELGTPLNVVLGHAQLLRESGEGESVERSAEIIARQCQRMTAIIRQLLDFSRRGVKVEEQPADLRHVAKETARMLDPMARKREVAIEVAAGDVPLVAAIGFGHAQQVFANLAINAIHAMPEGGNLQITLGPVKVRAPRADREAPHIRAVVRDTGVGMDAELLARIFEPFFTTKEVGEGTGLGLAVAHGIIEDRGGWIEVASEPGKGSTFTIYLPAAPASEG